MRYFVNNLPDYVHAPGAIVDIDKRRWKDSVIDIINAVLKAIKPKPKHCSGGLYIGCAGIAYSLYHTAIKEAFLNQKHDLLKRALEYANVSLEYCKRNYNDPETSLMIGDAGVYAICCVLNDLHGNKDLSRAQLEHYRSLARKLQPINFNKNGSDELFVGRAGYLCGTVFLSRHFKEKGLFKSEQEVLCTSIIKSGREYSKKNGSPCPLMFSYYKTEYLGAAHGLSSILQMLLCCPHFLSTHPSALEDVRDSTDYLLSLMGRNGNISPAMEDVGASKSKKDELVHWCHGSPGIVYLFAKAYMYFKDDRYLEACWRCAELTWKAGLLKKGPGICHGVSGSGYVFLLLYRMTGDKRHLHRAVQFAEFLLSKSFTEKSRTPDHPYSLFEGLSGTVCFLADLLNPRDAAYPLFDVFEESSF